MQDVVFLFILNLVKKKAGRTHVLRYLDIEIKRLGMIDYEPFWETLKHSEETTYTLITRHRVSGATIDRLRKNKPMNTTTLDELCGILACALQDIVRYVPDKKGLTIMEDQDTEKR